MDTPRTTEKFWTYPAESDSGKTILVTGRDKIEKFIDSGKYIYRINAYWDYDPQPDGLPCDSDAKLMEQATDALLAEFRKDKVGVLTGIYTGDGRRDWVFYTKNLAIFGNVFNRALAPLPTIPIVVEAASDPEWEEYLEMRDTTYVPDED